MVLLILSEGIIYQIITAYCVFSALVFILSIINPLQFHICGPGIEQSRSGCFAAKKTNVPRFLFELAEWRSLIERFEKCPPSSIRCVSPARLSAAARARRDIEQTPIKTCGQ